MAENTTKRFRCPPHWTIAQRLDHYTDKSGGPDACWPWTGYCGHGGYGFLKVKRVTKLVHRIAWTEKNGPIPQGMEVCHECDNPPCRNETHLFLGTRIDNEADKISKGRQSRGVIHGHSKLTEADVRAIRKAAGPQRAIAARFGITQGAVWLIRSGQRWQHLK